MPIIDICIIQVTNSARIVINFYSNKLLLTPDKQGEIINNKHVGGILRKWYFLRVPLHTYNVRSAKINLAKSSSITRAFIIVSNNNFMAYAVQTPSLVREGWDGY